MLINLSRECFFLHVSMLSTFDIAVGHLSLSMTVTGGMAETIKLDAVALFFSSQRYSNSPPQYKTDQ